MATLNELFQDHIKDLYSAEKQLTKALPKLAKKATNPTLKKSIEEHLTQTQGHVERLEEIAKTCGFKPTGMVCKGMQGLVEEADEHVGEEEPSEGLDAEIIACAQKAEHYEISAYGTARAWASELGLKECIALIEQTLNEELAADDLLSKLGMSEVNGAANPDSTSKAETSKSKTPASKATVR